MTHTHILPYDRSAFNVQTWATSALGGRHHQCNVRMSFVSHAVMQTDTSAHKYHHLVYPSFA